MLQYIEYRLPSVQLDACSAKVGHLGISRWHGRVEGGLCDPDEGETSSFACGSVHLIYIPNQDLGWERGDIEKHGEMGNR